MKSNRALLAVAASVVVAALVIAGLFAVGSPATARKFRADQRRVEQLQRLHDALRNHLIDQTDLPHSLDDLNPAYWENYGQPVDPRRDPVTGEAFDYGRLSDREYEVCANFETSSDDRRNVDRPFRAEPFPFDGGGGEGFFEYEPGRNCFDRTITNAELRNMFPGDPRFSPPERNPEPASLSPAPAEQPSPE